MKPTRLVEALRSFKKQQTGGARDVGSPASPQYFERSLPFSGEPGKGVGRFLPPENAQLKSIPTEYKHP